MGGHEGMDGGLVVLVRMVDEARVGARVLHHPVDSRDEVRGERHAGGSPHRTALDGFSS